MSIIYPLIQEAGPEFPLSDADFAELQQEGAITLSAELRQQLGDLAHFWVGQLRALQSPRPKQFRNRLKVMEERLKKAYLAVNLNREGALIWERHLFNWIRNTGVEGATNFFQDQKKLLISLQDTIRLMASLQKALPLDGGRRREFDDERLFISLADIYERAGGTPAAYWTEYSNGMAKNIKGSMADTPFRRFVQAFYSRLPVLSKRTLAGVDEALRGAMRSRGRSKSANQSAEHSL